MEGRGLLGCGWRGEERLGIAGEVLRAVGRVEAFGEDDDFGSLGGRGEDLCARVGEVDGFVVACGGCVSVLHLEGKRGMHTAGQLHEGKLDGLLQDCGHG